MLLILQARSADADFQVHIVRSAVQLLIVRYYLHQRLPIYTGDAEAFQCLSRQRSRKRGEWPSHETEYLTAAVLQRLPVR